MLFVMEIASFYFVIRCNLELTLHSQVLMNGSTYLVGIDHQGHEQVKYFVSSGRMSSVHSDNEKNLLDGDM